MRNLLGWRQADGEGQTEQRREIANVMCTRCARRWLVGRSIRHKSCAESLAVAVDQHFLIGRAQ